MSLELLLHTIGYPVVFVGAILEGETVLLIAGFLVHQGYLTGWLTWLVGALGATAGDQFFFYLGRRHADKAIAYLPAYLRLPIGVAARLVARNPTFVLVMLRFLVGMRLLLPVLCGAAGIGTRRFVAFNIATAALWAAFFLSLGYLFGEAAKPFLRQIQAAELILAIVLVIIAVVYQWVSRKLVVKMQGKNP